ncbi:MAG TPA: undecaprenyl-phosphate glucose phosphotransferase [Candidatus Margulisiibacteriota bacterium]|nr:undecaprenyl-phosphate glucose phosphotransferase [Candidatus Margulisiibacteriota bacterium]
MAASLESVSDSLTRSTGPKRVRLGSVEPAALALLKQLDPLVATIALLVCVLAYRQPLSDMTLGVGLLTFLIASPIFARSPRHNGIPGSRLSTTYSRIVVEWALVVAILLFLGFAFKVSATFSRLVMVTWFVATPVALLAAHGLRLRAHSILAANHGPRYIIVGANNVGFELFRRLPQKGFLGFFDFRSADRVSQVLDPDKLAGHCKDIASYARNHGVTAIYIALPLSNVPRIGVMIRELRDTTASIYFLPDVFAFDMIQGRLVDLNGMPAISVCDTPFHGMDAVLKRTMDVVLTGLALLAAAPLMAAIAVAVKLTSRGPALFRQRRYGLNGEQINVYKFRSMTVCEDGGVVTQATRNDARITPLGKFLRRTSLDELPQLLNVLQGQMSLVGPRPHAIAHNEMYRKLISGYMIRHKVRPGITGWAQVNGLRGETDTVDKMSARVKFDIDYLNSWSPWLDIKILLRTVMLVVRDDKAY